MTIATDEKSQLLNSPLSPVLQVARKPFSAVANATFKYYIHDTAEGYRLQLIGDLTDHQVSELNCCWSTAQTTLKGRKLILDLREVKHVDERGRQWLAGMGIEGASYIPESFLRDSIAGKPVLRTNRTFVFGVFDRLLNALRGCATSVE